jgi:L-cysteate sulfo-lyase
MNNDPTNTRDMHALARRISAYPRLRLGHFPTPLEPLKRLSERLSGPAISVKRDDASGMGQGGNKVRALEFVLPEALAAGADILLTAGVVQSNSVRQVAAAAAKAGLDCHFAMITDRVTGTDADYAETGNALLDHLYGATHEIISIKDDRTAVLERIAARMRERGRKPYIVPYGCANRTGAIGYLNAAAELAEQATESGVPITHVVHASGTGGTQAGLIAGFAALGLPIEVIGIDVDADPHGVRQRVGRILAELADEIGLDRSVLMERIVVEGAFSAGAYGQADQRTVDAIRIAARSEALTLDPVYSGKALAGLIGLCKAGRFKPSDHVVFLHTGGTPAIYAYRSIFGSGAPNA